MKRITIEIPDTTWAVGMDVVYVDEDGINNFAGFSLDKENLEDGFVTKWGDADCRRGESTRRADHAGGARESNPRI